MKFILMTLTLIALTGCYSRVYFDTVGEARAAFPTNEGYNVKQITDVTHPYCGRFEVKYKPY